MGGYMGSKEIIQSIKSIFKKIDLMKRGTAVTLTWAFFDHGYEHVHVFRLTGCNFKGALVAMSVPIGVAHRSVFHRANPVAS